MRKGRLRAGLLLWGNQIVLARRKYFLPGAELSRVIGYCCAAGWVNNKDNEHA
jgi:hypothetical protein